RVNAGSVTSALTLNEEKLIEKCEGGFKENMSAMGSMNFEETASLCNDEECGACMDLEEKEKHPEIFRPKRVISNTFKFFLHGLVRKRLFCVPMRKGARMDLEEKEKHPEIFRINRKSHF
ncbi:hypothetical protein IFM89_025341, partial [Coptis chinensis]